MADRRAVLIGAGITGTLTARELIRRGWDVTVVEAAHIGAGSSSRSAAGIRQQWSNPDTVRGMRFSVRFYREWRERTGAPEVPIRHNGYLFLAGDEAAFQETRRRVDMQRRVGLAEVEALSAAEVVARFPWVDAEQIAGASWCSTDGFLLPALVYQDAARDARDHGARIVQGAPVHGCEVKNGHIIAIHTDRGSFEGDVFVDCTNAWSRSLAARLGAEDLPVDPLKRYLWFLRRDGSMSATTLGSMPLVIAPSGVYCRPENEDTLLIGHAHPTRAEPGFTYEDQDKVESPFKHTDGVDAVPFANWIKLSEVLPPVGEFAGIVATTSGYYGTTPDHNPFFGFDRQLQNLVRLVGFSGHGAMFGPFTAQVGAALCEAGRDLDQVDVEGEQIGIRSFQIGRTFDAHEALVI